jgi:predicted enzyme related to lactoylglutathione lyase
MPTHQSYAHIRPEHPISAGTRIGHVHLKVADLERALGFYVGVLGFELITTYDDQAAFISAGGYHHHIGLNTWESLGGSPPPRGTTGLYHTAAPAITASARRCICATPTRTASNSIGIAPRSNGRATPKAASRCSPAVWTSPGCAPRRNKPPFTGPSK